MKASTKSPAKSLLKLGVLRFPGTNCDRDVMAFAKAKNYQVQVLWHLDQFAVNECDALILPGGFSSGDYLRSGALSALSPVMKSVKEFADFGKPVLGICNGFQILTEAGLLPGALVRNQNLRFIDDWVTLKIENPSPFFFNASTSQQKIRLPIAHGDGRFYAPQDLLKQLEDQQQVWLRYESNPNGSLHDIAGVFNKNRNVAALMPHPERALYEWMGGIDGWEFL